MRGSFVVQEYTVEELQRRIGYTFSNKDLLIQAITHSSFSNEQRINKAEHYERLEFLGDAVLELVCSEYLFFHYPEEPEGKLTKLRASTVCEPSLAFCARDLEIGKFLRLGKGEEATGGRDRESIIADVMEAIVGAIFLDRGIEEAKKYINKFILADLEDKQLFFDSKTHLQELLQRDLKKEFHYELLDETGPEHEKTFSVAVIVEDEAIGKGTGRTKKAAEQQAAYEALIFLKDKRKN